MDQLPTKVSGGNSHGYVIVDDYSRYTWVFFLNDKAKVQEIFKKFAKRIQNEFKLKIVKVRIVGPAGPGVPRTREAWSAARRPRERPNSPYPGVMRNPISPLVPGKVASREGGIHGELVAVPGKGELDR